MEYITLKNTDIRVSRLCMGGCPMGGYGWGRVSEEELISAVRRALDTGVTFFDTADTYGLGKSEETLARGLGGDRQRAVIATKFGVRVENGHTFYDNSPEYMKTALEASLKRLKTDCIDLYQIHYRDGKTPLEEVVSTLEEFKRAGKVRAFGLSNVSDFTRELEPFAGVFASCQEEYSLACRKNEALLKTLADTLPVTPMTWGSLGQGVLTGKYDKTATFGSDDRRSREVYVNFHGAKLEKNLKTVEAMRPIAEKHGVSVSAVAIRYILDNIRDSVVIAGVKRSAQLDANMEAFGWRLSEAELALLNGVSE